MALARTVTVLHRRTTGRQLEYEITADENGGYCIRRPGDPATVLRQGSDPLVVHGMRGGGPELLEEALQRARADVEQLRGIDVE